MEKGLGKLAETRSSHSCSPRGTFFCVPAWKGRTFVCYTYTVLIFIVLYRYNYMIPYRVVRTIELSHCTSSKWRARWMKVAKSRKTHLETVVQLPVHLSSFVSSICVCFKPIQWVMIKIALIVKIGPWFATSLLGTVIRCWWLFSEFWIPFCVTRLETVSSKLHLWKCVSLIWFIEQEACDWTLYRLLASFSNRLWNKKFCEELTAYFPFTRHGPHRKRLV